MFTEHIEKKREDQDQTIHEGIACDGCNMNPIKGLRYMSSVNGDTDFCQNCERAGVHSQHPLLKVRKPSQAPAKLICQYKNGDTLAPVNQSHMPANSAPENLVWERQSQQPQKQVRYSARFVKESFPDKHEIVCGDIFSKSWWMRNDGDGTWPTGTQLIQTSGDDMKAQVVTLHRAVPVGETYEFTVKCKAPMNEGRYTSFFRM